MTAHVPSVQKVYINQFQSPGNSGGGHFTKRVMKWSKCLSIMSLPQVNSKILKDSSIPVFALQANGNEIW